MALPDRGLRLSETAGRHRNRRSSCGVRVLLRSRNYTYPRDPDMCIDEALAAALRRTRVRTSSLALVEPGIVLHTSHFVRGVLRTVERRSRLHRQQGPPSVSSSGGCRVGEGFPTRSPADLNSILATLRFGADWPRASSLGRPHTEDKLLQPTDPERAGGSDLAYDRFRTFSNEQSVRLEAISYSVRPDNYLYRSAANVDSIEVFSPPRTRRPTLSWTADLLRDRQENLGRPSLARVLDSRAHRALLRTRHP